MALTKEQEARVKKCADELRGTINDLEDVLTEDEVEDQEFLSSLDEEVMECATCGWWEDAADFDEDGNCSDCYEDEDDE